MKVFIVSIGVIIIGVGAVLFGWDFRNYENLQTHLKYLTESSAAYAALCFDDSDFENSSDVTYNELDVMNGAEYFVNQASKDMDCFQNGTIAIEECIADSEADSVSITISFTSNYDLFRAPFLTVHSISHSSCYEWISYTIE